MTPVIAMCVLGCKADPTTSSTDIDDNPPLTVPTSPAETYGVTEDFAVGRGCDTDGDVLNAVYDGEQAVLVHGDSPRDAGFAAQVAAFYDTLFDVPLIVRSSADLTPADRQHHLMVFGGSDTNSLLTDLNGTLPVWFDPGVFTFAGYRWPDQGHGLALIHPSPYADDRYVVLYAGNTLDGAWATFTVPTGLTGFVAVRGRSTVQVTGTLCASGPRWDVPVDAMGDVRDNWDRLVEDLTVREGSFHAVHAEPGSDPEAALDDHLATLEAGHQDALDQLEVDALPWPIQTYLYPTRDDKDEATDDTRDAHANDLNVETHRLVGEGVTALEVHEDVRVLAWHQVGDAGTLVLEEGLVVMVDGTWAGVPVQTWASGAAAAGTLPPLRDLIDDFFGAGGGDLDGAGAAGSLVTTLRDAYGIGAVKALYLASNLDTAFVDELGLTTDEVEAAWLAALP